MLGFDITCTASDKPFSTQHISPLGLEERIPSLHFDGFHVQVSALCCHSKCAGNKDQPALLFECNMKLLRFISNSWLNFKLVIFLTAFWSVRTREQTFVNTKEGSSDYQLGNWVQYQSTSQWNM